MEKSEALEAPDWRGSVGWASSCKPKGRALDSQSGHMPGPQWGPGPQLGVCKRQPIDVSLLSLPHFPSL